MSQNPPNLTEIPAYAVYVWKDGDSIVMHMDGHQVRIKLQDWEWLASPRPCSQASHPLASCPPGGLKNLAMVLKARETFEERTIGSAPSPTQWDIINSSTTKLFRAEERLKRAQELAANRKLKEEEKERKLEEAREAVKTLTLADLGL